MTWLAWIASSRLGRAVAGAVGLLALILAYGARRERRGEKKAVERVSRRAEAAAEKRKEIRDEINDDSNAADARDRLHTDWTD